MGSSLLTTGTTVAIAAVTVAAAAAVTAVAAVAAVGGLGGFLLPLLTGFTGKRTDPSGGGSELKIYFGEKLSLNSVQIRFFPQVNLYAAEELVQRHLFKMGIAHFPRVKIVHAEKFSAK
jgi:hypothetical protein